MLLLSKVKSFRINHNSTSIFIRNCQHHPEKDEIKIIQRENEEDKIWIRSSNAAAKVASGVGQPSTKICESDMIHHLKARGYENLITTPQAVRTLSSIFTFPMSLSHGINTIYRSGTLPRLTVCMIGARAEHSLPRSWWFETLISSPRISNIEILMLGPGITLSKPEFQKDSFINWTQGSKVNGATPSVIIRTPKLAHNYLHDHKDLDKILLHSDMFVLFHPGFGSEAHRSTWEPTLKLLLETRKPILCTAHGQKDLETDVEALYALALGADDQELGDPLEFLIPPQPNPFRSLKRIVVDNSIVVNNHSIYAFQAK